MTHDSFPPRPDDGVEDELLELYLAGKLTGSDVERVEQWMAAHSEGRLVVEAFRRGAVDVTERTPDAWEVVTRVRSGRMPKEEVRGTGLSRNLLKGYSRGRGVFKGHPLRQLTWSAATVLMLGGIAIFLRHTGIFSNARADVALADNTPVSTYVTPNGQRATITLPDGNIVTLNVGSRLDVPADYLTAHRTLRLVGEALFNVTHRAGTPFLVFAGGATARVLGTTFLMRHYSTDTATTIAVREGKVAVQRASTIRPTAPIVLMAARQVEITPTGAMHVHLADTAQYTFADGVLTLDGLSLQAAIPQLNRWYDVDIRLGDTALARRQIEGGFTAGSPAELEEQLAWAFKLRVVRAGRTLTLFPQ